MDPESEENAALHGCNSWSLAGNSIA